MTTCRYTNAAWRNLSSRVTRVPSRRHSTGRARIDKTARAADVVRVHPPPARPRRRSRAAIVLGAVFGAFVLALATLVTSALRPRGDVQTFAPTAGRAVRPAGARGATDTLTLDARDERAWRYASLAPPELAPAAGVPAWDVAARRYRVIARDSVADLGPVAFESVGRAP